MAVLANMPSEHASKDKVKAIETSRDTLGVFAVASWLGDCFHASCKLQSTACSVSVVVVAVGQALGGGQQQGDAVQDEHNSRWPAGAGQ